MRLQTQRAAEGKEITRFNAWFVYLIIWPLLLPVLPAQAHPHVFIDYQISLVAKPGQIDGFVLLWKVDEMNTELVLEEFDINHNHRLEPAEAFQAAENMRQNLAEYEYFSRIRLNQKRVLVRQAQSIQVSLENKRLVYQWFLPCPIKLSKQNQQLSFESLNPTNYVAFMPMSKPFMASSSLRYQILQQPRALYEPLGCGAVLLAGSVGTPPVYALISG